MGAVNDIYLLQVKGSQGGQDIIHTLHFKSAVVGSDAAIQQDLIDSWQATSQVAFLATQTANYTLGTITAQRICGSLPLPAATEESVSAPGTGGATTAANQLPVWIATLSREATGFAGKSYKGRFFLPLTYDQWLDGNSVVAGYITIVTAYLTSLASFLAGGGDADWDLFVYSRKLAAVPGVQCQNTGAVVTSLSVSPYATSMRSRRSRTGA